MPSERLQEFLASASPDQLTAVFLDIGQGDATALLLPGSQAAVIVDCGAGGAVSVQDCLEAAQVAEILLVVLTHSDNDHVGGIMEVLRNFSGAVSEVAFNLERLPRDLEEKKYRLLLRQLADYSDRSACRLTHPRVGDQYVLAGVLMTVIHPSEQNWYRVLADNALRNDGSVVLQVAYQGKRVLLTADVKAQGWRWILDRRGDIKADVLKYPHHGAWYADWPNPQHVLELVDPELVVLSVGSRNAHGHPGRQALDALRGFTAKRSGCRFECTQVSVRCDPAINVSHRLRRHRSGLHFRRRVVGQPYFWGP